ncbi:uncharacterized protein LOC143855694 [Tasmannia lanceolata]|uniref:uncharacterized protein LOC143855694 n=1 Tax=Tasmannia lanceolata TaxID=3420 RepID=UPI004062F139
MRLDTEPTYCHSSPAVEPASKVVENDENSVRPGLLKADYMVGKEGKYENCKMDANALPTEKCNGDGHGDVPGPHSYTGTGNSICIRASEGGNKVASYSLPGTEFELSKNEMDVYTNKNIMEFALPELMVCFKESNYHVIKDICIDEGVPSLDKTLVENETDDRKFIGFPHSDLDENRALTKEAFNCSLPSSDDLKSLNFYFQRISDDYKDVSHPNSPDRLHGEDGGIDTTDETVNDISGEVVVPDEFHLVQNSTTGDFQSDQATNEKEKLANSVGTSSAEVSNNSRNTEKFPINSKMETGSVTFDFESSPSVMSGSGEVTESANWQQSGRSLSGLENEVPDSLTGSSRSFFIQHGYGEPSFSGIRSDSGAIVNTGSMGSISLRSDISTASTGSFAFPVLQSEWDTSPVKMVKGDRRKPRKNRGCWAALFCCRF